MSTPAAPAGWPRDRLPYTDWSEGREGQEAYARTRSIPTLFIGGANQAEDDWLSFDDERLEACKAGACTVCGLALDRTVVFGHTARLQTNGPPVHPRCFAVALRFCPRYQQRPYLSKRRIVAYVYEGDDFAQAIRITARTALVDRAAPVEPKLGPRGLLGDTYDLKASHVATLTRAKAITLAKTNPLGTGATP